jgi:Uma2 family endonuclease
MNAVTEANLQPIPPPPFAPANGEIVYPDSHEDDMGESNWHYALLAYLWSALQLLFGEKEDVYVAANMNLYYEPGRPEFYYTPDLMVAFGVANYKRKVYKLWEEKVFPQVVFEIASDRTWKEDLGDKLDAYNKLGAEEYYILDSQNFLPLPLMAYRRENGRLKSSHLAQDRVLSPRLGLEIVLTDEGFRLFNPQTQEFIPSLTDAQAEAKAAQLKADAEAAKAKAAEARVAELLAEIAKLKGEV